MSAYSFFSLRNKLKLLQYSIGHRLINRVPKGLQYNYELVRELKSKGTAVSQNADKLEIAYALNDRSFRFLVDEDSSDGAVFRQIVMEEEYATLIELFTQLKLTPKLMIDAGANVGYTSIYFSAYYPDMKIIALEPKKSTYIRLVNNLKINQLNNVVSLQKGVWSKNTFVKADLNFRDGQDWSFRLIEAKSSETALFEVTTIAELLKNEDVLDFLKMDIEGGEVDVFKGNLEWLTKVKVIAIEIHDEFECREEIETSLQQHGFELTHSGELTIGVNQSLCKVSYS